MSIFRVYSDSFSPILPTTAAIIKPFFGPPVISPVIINRQLIQIPEEYNLNADVSVHKKVTKYFYYLTLDKWLHDEMIDILGYLSFGGGKVSIISNISEYREDASSRDSKEAIEKKIEYIEKYILTEDTMHRLLNKLTKEVKNINWYDMHKNKYVVKEYIHRKLKRIFKKTLIERSSKK